MLSNTTASLSSISEGSTYGVEGEDLPPTVPRRRRSFETRSSAASTTSLHEVETLESINEETPLAQQSAEINVVSRPSRKSSTSRRSGSRRKSHHSASGRSDDGDSTVNNHAEEEKKEGKMERSKRKRRSSTSRPQHSSVESQRGERDSNDGSSSQSKSNRTELSGGRNRNNSRRRSSSSHRRSSSSATSESREEEKSKEKARKKRSTSPGRSSSRSSEREPKEELATGSNYADLSQQDEKAKETARRKSSKSSTRSSSRPSDRDDDKVSKQEMVEERRHSRRSSLSGRRSQRSSSRHSASSSRHSSEWGSQADSSTPFSRDLDRSGPQHEFRRIGSSGSTSSESSEEELPGAFRVSSHHTSRLRPVSAHSTNGFRSFLSSVSSVISGHSFAFSDEHTVTDTTITGSSGSPESSTVNSTRVTAQVARDLTSEEIEAARQQGRTQVLTEAAGRDEGIVVAAVAQPRRSKAAEERKRRRKRGILFGMCCCLLFLIVIFAAAGFVLMNRQKASGKDDEIQQNATIAPVNNNSSELDAVISFDPPTAADCASIANGTDVAGQESMFTQFVDMFIEITTDSEEDAALLVKLLKQQIQLRLIPYLIGCNDVVGNIIGNGVVESVSNETSPCLFQNNPLCLEVLLTVKIYLRRNEDGTTAISIMSDVLLEEDLTETLELPPTVQTAGVRQILPSDFSTDALTGSPSWKPSEPNKDDNIFVFPSVMPNTASPSVKPTTGQTPVSSTQNPTRAPTEQQDPSPAPTSPPSIARTSRPSIEAPMDGSNTIRPTRSPTKPPTLEPTQSPTRRPTLYPTAVPIPGSTPLPTAVATPSPTLSPTVAPSVSPTQMPSSVPSPEPSPLPSAIPSSVPSLQPSPLPSADPSSSPSLVASASPSVCTTDTKLVPQFDTTVGVTSYQPVSPGDIMTSIQRFPCMSGFSSDVGIIRYNEADCTVECLNTVPFSAIQSYCSVNPGGGYTFAIPGPFTADTQLYIGHVSGSFGLTCGAQLPVLNLFDETSPVGCFADAQQRAMTGTTRIVDSAMTVQRCLDHCFHSGFLYAGLENRRDCFCDNDYMRYGRLPDSACNRNCVDGLKCGGDWRMSVYPTGVDGHDGDYTPVPSAAPVGDMGCWNEDISMEITTLNPVWVVRCVEHCRSNSKAYAGLRRLDNRNKCYCGDAYQAGGTATTCSNDCAGSCGGTDTWNIYAT